MKRRRKSNLNIANIVLFVITIIAVILCVYSIITAHTKAKEITGLKSTIDSLEAAKETLAVTISEQAVSIEDLTNRLVFFATPEEAADSQYTGLTDSSLTSTENKAAHNDSNSSASNDAPYPELFAATHIQPTKSEGKIAYLTFDDGPSELTLQVLDILDRYQAKATFFVIGTKNEEYQNYYQSIIERGHTLALHSNTHKYTSIYQSVDSFLADYNTLAALIKEKTGYTCSLYRFPGGSVNSYNRPIINDLIQEMTNRGFIFYDWNVSCGDGSNAATRQSIYDKVMNEVHRVETPVILMHDGQGHEETIAALPSIIETLAGEGYTFKALTPELTPVQFPH